MVYCNVILLLISLFIALFVPSYLVLLTHYCYYYFDRKTRTQIVDDSDASYVTFALDVFPGCKVVESGTGSGNMTLSLARAVAPNGHVYSYEYNSTRANEARLEFERLFLFILIFYLDSLF